MSPTIRTVQIVALFPYDDKRAGRATLLELTAMPVDGGPRVPGNVFGRTTDPFIQDALHGALACGTGLVTIELEDGWNGPRFVAVQEVEKVA